MLAGFHQSLLSILHSLIFAQPMQVHTDLNLLPTFRNAVLTIGTYDGVHMGHQQIIAHLKEEALKINGETVIVTFHPHPRKVVSSVPGDIKLLSTLDEKIKLIEKAGINHLVVVHFDYRFSNLHPEEYVKDFLYKNFKPHTLIIGYDHRFGKGREGDYHLLEKMGNELGFIVKEIPEHILNNAIISSTKIRNALLTNDIAAANSFLGYDYFFEGLVIEGNKIGRTLGYPTANLHIESEEKLIPGDGVYAVKVEIIDEDPDNIQLHKGMMNIGLRPTVDGKKRMIEVNIFNFNEDIYDRTLRIYVHSFIRGEVKFNGLEELKMQLAKDKLHALAALS